MENVHLLTWSAMVICERLLCVEQLLLNRLLSGFKSSVRGAESAPRSQQRRETASHYRDAPHLGHYDAAFFALVRKNSSFVT